jgi:N-acyl-D-amino-acid deacylase
MASAHDLLIRGGTVYDGSGAAGARADVAVRGDRIVGVGIIAERGGVELDVRMVMAHPTTMIGSDGVPAAGSKPHPRLYGCFPRVLGHYVRDEDVLDLATAIHRMTGMPAAKFGLIDRGVVRPGAFADLVVFDPARIRDTATYDDPCRFPEGIRAVYVNGVAVTRDGTHTGARAGRALRRGRA